jgi:hypothetical protein
VEEPLPLLPCGALDGVCRLLLPDEPLLLLLLDEPLLLLLLDEPLLLLLLDELLEPLLDGLPELLVPVPETDPVELDEELFPVLVAAAWLVPGRITATAAAPSTLTADTVTVVAVSRRRPRSRSATACDTWRAAFASFELFTPSV